ncbi:floral homeotic protein AGAMOUS-like [Lotus japonicus]|uniref:floral homeotic protein AGAMOUS-like n=1 Tax=Lotus japonicus TaxID=34305 RepID=UPI0025859A20|nr:floral homeotic protein AGAMOUS-like [Lotus japonicus]XP_057426756.1 floral homeotic protein AGAMOUS-like [Lotus japonicus]
MGRGRIPMEPIQNEKTRRTTFLKRRDGLMKKVKELSILCDVNACLIMYAEGLDEPQTWPKKDTEVQCIIQKYCNTANDRRPKIYDVHEYYKDKVKKIEAEISKVHKEELKILYPTWDDSFNNLGEEQLRSFISKLDAKLDACNQKINILKGDHDHRGKEKAREIVTVSRTGYETQVTPPPYLASNPMNQLNGLMMQNMSQAQVFQPPPPMNMLKANNDRNLFHNFGQSSQPPSLHHFGQNRRVDWADQVRALSYDPTTGTNYDKNKLAVFPFHHGQSSQSPPSLLNFGQNGRVDWANQVGALANYDPTTGMLINGVRAENNQNISQCYCNGNMQRMQPCSIGNLHTQYPAQIKSKEEEAFLSYVPPGFQPNGFYGTDVVQAHMFSHMHGFGRK